MGYGRTLEDAADWLVGVVNSDHGWGMSPGQASSIVNTAEAVYVLSRSRKYRSEIVEGLAFITTRLFPSLDKQGPRTRYVMFALLAMLDHLETTSGDFLLRCTGWLLEARNNDGGWGHLANDQESRIFPTCLSLTLLARLGVGSDRLEPSYNWLVSKAGPSGWSFDGSNSPSTTATAQAVVALREVKDASSELFTKSKEFLLATTHWGTERENLPGTLWDHCTYMWVFPALVSLDVDPYAPTLANGVREINRLICPNGWTEPSGGESIRGQFWAVFALDSLKEAFDPAIHVYRIDSERTQQALREPEFVNISIHRSWAVIVPRFLYKGLTYALVAVFFLTFTGLYRSAPRELDFVVGVTAAVASYVLVTRRKGLFPKWLLRCLVAIASALTFVDLVLGWSIADMFNAIRKLGE